VKGSEDRHSLNATANFDSHRRPDGGLVLSLTGHLDAAATARLWQPLVALLERETPGMLVVDANGVDFCDGAGLGLLTELARRQQVAERQYTMEGLRPELAHLLQMFDPGDYLEVSTPRAEPCCLLEDTGRAAFQAWQGLMDMVRFTGELTLALMGAARKPRRIRWSDVWLTTEKAGVNALPIIALISFLVGLIMAFQAAIPMRQFGVEIYVANLIALSMLREMGPLMTAIILAGRSGSAFAAELGTMKINEELDALTTMGLAPVPFLVVTRVLAAVIVAPLLTLFANLLGLAGGAVVLLTLGYPLVTYLKQVQAAVTFVDLAGGLTKTLVFALIVAGVGCLFGLKTGPGASAVGDAATRAVVAGIILIVVADGLFAILFYYLGL
jgi:phospholipid/cholesterol/gamma-HCH transport system permease protein